eukprot:1192357-Pyramimonas_sp.AAC.1
MIHLWGRSKVLTWWLGVKPTALGRPVRNLHKFIDIIDGTVDNQEPEFPVKDACEEAIAQVASVTVLSRDTVDSSSSRAQPATTAQLR